ncbi:sugar ABC transporter substrate-binding protein [Arthrobacter sp. Soil762]|uniref:sugar ABC transporter substrate-binding protein n=1 Tax=Arthrobacter sp. Soil762 TaxID=1736401 RepID=UPI000AE9CE3F|nr:extracellular solute-binding protein [Arthrobacter sp. Soil762]
MNKQIARRSLLVNGGLAGLAAIVGPSFLTGCAPANTGSSSAKPSTMTGLWVPYDTLIQGSQAAMAGFIGSNQISFQLNTVPWADWDRTIRAFPQQSTVPDVVIADGPALQGYAANDILAPLDEFFTKEDLGDFLGGTTPSATWKGKFYGPATNESSQALVYNKAILDKHGITPPTELAKAWTWKELREIMLDIQAKERKARGDDQFWGIFVGQGNFLAGATYTGLNIVRSNGAKDSKTYQAISENGLSVAGYADTDEAMEAYHFLQDLYNADGLSPQSKSPDFFYNNQIAFWITNPDVAIGGIAKNAPSMNWGVSPHPYFKTPIVQTDSYHLAVPKNAKSIEWSAKLIADMVSGQNAKILAEKQQAIPMRKSLLTELPYLQDEHMKVFTDTVAEWAVPRPVTPGWSEYDSTYTQMLQDIATGADIQKTVSGAVQSIETKLARYKGIVG